MYNRYIPQPDGSYRRNRMPDARPREPVHRAPPPTPESPCPPPPPPQPQPECPSAPPAPVPCAPKHHCKQPPSKQENSIGSFLRQILPKDLDTGDLLISLLLLLMAGDCAEDQNTAMLTLALYLFM
jgi:hypothetical protein